MAAVPLFEVIAGRYEVGPVIGRGGMGEVRRACDLRLGRDVAIKFLRRDLAAQPEVRSRFEHEARAAAGLSHPAVVTVYDSGEVDGTPYLVMECLPGDTLADRLARGPLDPDLLTGLADDLLSALDAAHEVGVVHRDVKPANVLFAADGRAKLADFGIAKSTESLDHTVTGQVIGTPTYLAPERLAGGPASPASDLYSVGVVLYEALTGEKPFHGNTPMEVAHAIATGAATPVAERCPDADPRLTAAIDRAMAPDPSDRFTSAAGMRAAVAGDGGSEDAGTTQVFPVVDATVALPVIDEPVVEERVDMPLPAPVPPRIGSWRGPRPRPGVADGRLVARAALVALAALAFGLIVRAATDGDPATTPAGADPSQTTVPAAPEATLPPALDDALAELEAAVQP